jgi:hypothetical protein
MLYSYDPSNPHLYPCGVVFDANGRRLDRVIACNPETGEVVMADPRQSMLEHVTQLLGLSRRVDLFRPHRLSWWDRLFLDSRYYRHGFWPAPLRLYVVLF